ncbi:MAG: class I SAM-dependent methyltransferase [Deltaproteobacteria bacterium]|nr:class I SAM-dependent methyltransferase [Deltaproteobacteria bacterium]
MSKEHPKAKNLSLHAVHLPQKPAGRGPFAVELLEISPEDAILNVGCFDGGLEYHFLLGKVREFHGIDMNPEAIARARAWSFALLERPDYFQIAPAENIPFPDAYFDKVLCLDTFEHVLDENKAADEIFRVLKPGGALVLSVPHDFLNFLDPDELTRGARNFTRKFISHKPPLDHPRHRHYSETALRDFFKHFEIDYVHRCGTPIFWGLAMLYTGLGLSAAIVNPLSKITAPLENLEYRTRLPTGFNIVLRARKPAGKPAE